MVVCVIGVPSAGKTTFIKKYGKDFHQIISDELFEEIGDWSKVTKLIREEILTTEGDIIVEIDPNRISDLIDYIVEVNPPNKPQRKLNKADEFFFYEWKEINCIEDKVKIKGTNLKWEMLNKRFSKYQKNPPWKWR